MAKLALVGAFLLSFLPALCFPQRAPEPVVHQPVSAPIMVEPRSTKGW